MKRPHMNSKTHSNLLPFQIAGYSFVRELNTKKPERKYLYGLYRNKDGKLGFAKIWTGTLKNSNYYWLKNEISFYKWFSKLPAPRLQSSNQIRPPHFISEINDSGRLVLLTEYISNGKPLLDLQSEKKAQIYAQALNFISRLNNFSSAEHPPLLNRPSYYWLCLLPVVFLKSLFKYTSAWRTLFRGVVFLLFHLRTFLVSDRKVIHRDLSDYNIVKNKSGYWILDFQLCCLSNSVIDEVVINLKHFNDPKFIKFFNNHTSNQYSNRFRTYAVYFSLYDLALNSNNSSRTLKFIQENTKNFSLQLIGQMFIDSIYGLTHFTRRNIVTKNYDPSIKKIGTELVSQIRKINPNLKADLVGSVALGIEGQNDVDILIQLSSNKFKEAVSDLVNKFGNPTKKRKKFIEWKFPYKQAEVEINLMDPGTGLFKERYESFLLLKNNKHLLAKYRQFKKQASGLPEKKYLYEKANFFNNILGR